MATFQEIQELKQQWRNDPCWDLAETSGFEDHANELHAYQTRWEGIWEEQRQQRIEEYAKRIGTRNLDIAAYIQQLEARIEQLERLLL